MIDRPLRNLAEDAPIESSLVRNFRDLGWTGRLAWYLRVMAGVSLCKGLYHWAAICGFIGEEGGFEAHIQSWQATTVYFATIDLVAAVGLWLAAPWGVVVWLTSTVSMIVVHAVFNDIDGTDLLAIAFGMAAVGGYLALAVFVAREHPS